LVIQYAQAEAVDAQEEIERMEAKVRKQVTKETLQGLRLSGKRRVELDEEDE
jgi:multiple RNA-binding domain-containing protein 1